MIERLTHTRIYTELFQIRVGDGDESKNRFATFDELLRCAVDEIKRNLFKKT